MTELQAIAARHSRRVYTGGVPAGHAADIHALCARVGAEYDIYCALEEDAAGMFGGFTKTYGLFKGVQALVVLGTKPGVEDSLERLGRAGEAVVLEATKRGLGTCWVGGTFDRAAVQGKLPAGVEVKAVLTIGAVAPEMKGREKLMYSMVHRSTKTPAEMSEVEGEAPAWFAQGLAAAAKAPSAVNAQPVTFHWKGGKATATVPATRDMQWIDLGIAKLHFELAANGHFGYGNEGRFLPQEET